MQPNALLIDPLDNVVTVLREVPPGDRVVWAGGGPLAVREEIPTGHKVAIAPIAAGAAIRKYGHPIGTAGEAIAPGDRVHTHNLTAVER